MAKNKLSLHKKKAKKKLFSRQYNKISGEVSALFGGIPLKLLNSLLWNNI